MSGSVATAVVSAKPMPAVSLTCKLKSLTCGGSLTSATVMKRVELSLSPSISTISMARLKEFLVSKSSIEEVVCISPVAVSAS